MPEQDYQASQHVVDRKLPIYYYGAVIRSTIFTVLLAVLFLGCSSYRPLSADSGVSISRADKAAATARSMVGRPYKYQGETPSGFDCSGLVRYSYLTAGLDVPHNTSALRERTRPVNTRDIRKGDLLFFNQRGKKYSHVGISLGGSEFVHAPSSGKKVRINSLDDPYWKKHFLGARRF